jgi:hypothetical protein
VGIDRANNELNDYYGPGADHRRALNGRDDAEQVMEFQRVIPQHYIVHMGGGNGWWNAGDNQDRDRLDDTEWDDVMSGIQDSFLFSRAPFSTIISMVPRTGNNWAGSVRQAFHDELDCYNFVGPTNNPSDLCMQRFISGYSDRITDGSRTYRNAIGWSLFWANLGVWGFQRMRLGIDQSWGGGLAHGSLADEYRNIDRWRFDEGEDIDDGEERDWEITNRAHYFNTNGAYLVFHGIIENNLANTDDGTIEILIDRWQNGQYVNHFSMDWDIENRRLIREGETEQGGTDTCSMFLNSAFMRTTQTSDLRITLSFNSANADFIRIERFEFMEIGL